MKYILLILLFLSILSCKETTRTVKTPKTIYTYEITHLGGTKDTLSKDYQMKVTPDYRLISDSNMSVEKEIRRQVLSIRIIKVE